MFVVKNNKTECLIKDINVSCMFEDSKNNIWVGTVNDGVRFLEKKTREISYFKEELTLPDNVKLSNNRIRCFCEDDKQNIWIGTYKGITIYSPETKKSSILIHNESASYSLRHNSVYSIYKDRQGTIWVGSYYGGVSYFNPAIELYSFYGTSSKDPSMLNGLIIGNMTEDEKGNLYIATEEGGINLLNPNTGLIKTYDKSNSNLPHNTIKSIWYDTKYQRLYIGTFTEGLWYKAENSQKFNKLGNTILSTNIQKVISQIIPFNDKYIIISTQDNVYKLDRNSLELSTLVSFPSLDFNNIGIIQTMFIDSDEILWISSSEKGLFNLNLKTSRIQNFNNLGVGLNPAKSGIRQIQQGADGRIYLLSQSQLLSYDKATQQFKILNNNDSLLLSDNYYKLACLSSGHFIITADSGITLLDPVSLRTVHLPFAEIFPLKSINKSSGLYTASRNKQIYIGGLGGMLVLNEKDIETISELNKNSHRLFFSSLSINNKMADSQSSPDILPTDISYADFIRLNYKQNNLSLTFASSDFIHNNSVLYEYILENFDKQWTITNDKIIRYTSLPPGRYSLTVREAGNKYQKIHLDINISPPFYFSIWAYIIYAILLISLFIFFVCFTQRNIYLKASLNMEHREKLQLASLNKMKINFFTNVSHEFRTPLTLISSQIDITLKNTNMPQSLKKSFLKIKKHTNEMRFLIDELMYFNKLEQGTLAIMVSMEDISSFIEDIYESFKEYARMRNITFKYEQANEPINVWFDRMQIQKVVYNLLSNAFKFTNDGGSITIKLKRKKDHVEFSVLDTGIGMKAEELEKVFDRFYQVNQDSATQRVDGMGIGLSLSKNIVNQHHGDIFVESKAGVGTCFTVRLLLGSTHFTELQKSQRSFDETEYFSKIQHIENKEDKETEEEEEKIFKENADLKANILIIEDNEELLQLLIEAFSSLYNVTTADNGESGLNFAIETRPDIILSGVMIPRISGLDLCKKLKTRADTSHIPILLITARSSLKQNVEGLQYGADDYIVKPFNIELLLLKCNNLVKSRKEMQAKFQQVFSTIENEKTGITTNGRDQLFLKKAVTIVESNLINTDFDINSWARELNVGRSKLFQKIKEITGYTPNEYIIIIKMKKATILLKEEPNMTIAEIAYKAGFTSPGYFSKSFKEYYGLTPLQYRQS
ncbi:ATP-binding protein [Dysgonomonas termitidis]